MSSADEERIEQALRLLDEIECWFALENGLIDPVDHEQWSAFLLLQVAEGKATLYDLSWGQGNCPENIHDQNKREQQALAAWNARMKQEA